ncbi:YcaO-like family protein [Ignavigranum ruoffiae]
MYERHIDQNKSLVLGKEMLKKLNLTINMENFKCGKFCTVIKVTDNEKIPFAAGKGVSQQAIISAIFETIEHSLFENMNMTTTPISLNSILEGDIKLKYDVPLKLIKKKKYENKIDCYEFKNEQENKVIYYPAFLINPNHKPPRGLRFLRKYCSNNGLACGVGFEEAIIHAINEVVERHSVSQLYKNYFIRKELKLKNISMLSLPVNLVKLWKNIEESIGSEITVFDITTVDGINTYYAFAKHSKFPLPLRGSGSSIFAEYAIERALMEIFQCYSIMDEADFSMDLLTLQKFNNNQIYMNILFHNFCEKDYKKTNLIKTIGDSVSVNNLNVIYDKMTMCLKKADFNFYFNIVYNKNNLYAIKVFIPGTDNFQAIMNGCYLIPSEI